VRGAPAAAGAKILSFPGLLRLVLRTQPRSAFASGAAQQHCLPVGRTCRSAPPPADRGSVQPVGLGYFNGIKFLKTPSKMSRTKSKRAISSF